MSTVERKLSAEHIRLIESVLAKDNRVEIVPIKDGIKVLCIERHEVKRH